MDNPQIFAKKKNCKTMKEWSKDNLRLAQNSTDYVKMQQNLYSYIQMTQKTRNNVKLTKFAKFYGERFKKFNKIKQKLQKYVKR